MNQIWQQLKISYPFLIRWEARGKVFTLPGFDGIPLVDVYQFFMNEIRSQSLSNRSKSIAYSFFLAIFPGLTFVFTLIPYLPYFRDLDTNLLGLLKQVLPNQETYNFLEKFVEPILHDLSKHKRGGLLGGSLLLVLFLTSNGVLAMMHSFDKAHAHYKKRNAVQNRWVAIKITVLISFLFLFSLVLIVLGQEMVTLVSHLLHIHSSFTKLALHVVRYVFIVLMFFFSISLIYYYGPNTRKKYKFISTGATVATILSILVSIFYSYYVSNFSKLNVIFGSIGTIMLLMIWLNINAFVLLIGYEINASIHYNVHRRSSSLEQKPESVLIKSNA
jgi:membrane protein